MKKPKKKEWYKWLFVGNTPLLISERRLSRFLRIEFIFNKEAILKSMDLHQVNKPKEKLPYVV